MEIKNLPHLLELEGKLRFTAAYRDRTELSVPDRQVLDKIADALSEGPKSAQSRQWSPEQREASPEFAAGEEK